jgi:hypothetical protein
MPDTNFDFYVFLDLRMNNEVHHRCPLQFYLTGEDVAKYPKADNLQTVVARKGP